MYLSEQSPLPDGKLPCHLGNTQPGDLDTLLSNGIKWHDINMQMYRTNDRRGSIYDWWWHIEADQITIPHFIIEPRWQWCVYIAACVNRDFEFYYCVYIWTYLPGVIERGHLYILLYNTLRTGYIVDRHGLVLTNHLVNDIV